jgi:hypothetical protein
LIDQDIIDLGDDELIGNHDGRGGRSDDEDGTSGGTNVTLDGELGSDDGDAGAGHLAGGNNEDQPGDVRLSVRSSTSNQSPSPVASIASKVIKRSRSPSFNLEDLGRLGSEASVKREPSSSPEIEITDSRSIRGFVDLTLDDDVIDLTQEDVLEE